MRIRPDAPRQGRKPDLDRHETARAARREFAALLVRLKDECGIERKKVAEMLGVTPQAVSRAAAEAVNDRPTLAPDPGWRATLAPKLDELGIRARQIAAGLAQPPGSSDEREQ